MNERRRPPRAIEIGAKVLAVFGGMIALLVAITIVVSVIGRWLFNTPVPGDFELAQAGTAIAVFAFLPYCQLVRGNIVVDTFTTHLPSRMQGALDGLWDLVYAGAMGLVAGCLVWGTLDNYASNEVSMVLRIPMWPGIAFGALSCGFLALIALITALGMMRGRS